MNSRTQNDEDCQNKREQARLVLASASPRRQDLLRSLGLEFDIIPSQIEEITDKQDPADIVLFLSLAKAQEVAQKLPANSQPVLVLGSDTIVVLAAEVLGKPQSKEEAFQMLMRLSGKEHQVYTGVSIVELPLGSSRSCYRASSVFFRRISPEEARFYVETGEPMDKAGAYALQGIASAFVERIEGCYSNIIGLPVSDTVRLLREHGLSVLGSRELP